MIAQFPIGRSACPRIRYPIFAMLFAFAFTGYVQRSSVAVAAERMMPELGLSQVQIGWLFTAFLITYAVFQIPGALIGTSSSLIPLCFGASAFVRATR